MPDYTGDLRGTRLTEADLTGATLHKVRLNDARFRMVDLSGVVMRSVSLAGTAIDGELWEFEGLTINGVEVLPLVEAELLRRDPVRALLRPADPAGLREAWAALELDWAATYDRVAAMPAATAEISVEDEWSFVQTLRHLVFVTDGWLGAAEGAGGGFHPAGLPFTEIAEFMDRSVDLGIDPDASPGYAEVLELRADRAARVRAFLADVSAEQLAREVNGPPWDAGEQLTVLRCLRVLLNEEYEHHRFAERDLDLIEAGNKPVEDRAPATAG